MSVNLSVIVFYDFIFFFFLLLFLDNSGRPTVSRGTSLLVCVCIGIVEEYFRNWPKFPFINKKQLNWLRENKLR